jgi:hypothetical protein
MRFLVAMRGQFSREWLFIAVTAHVADAEMIAEHWVDAEVFDLL